MQDPPQPSINSWLEDEILQQYRHDRKAVDADWSSVFGTNGHPAPTPPATAVLEPPAATEAPPQPASSNDSPAVAIAPNDQVIPLRGPALRIAENMAASLTIPVATSQRVMPVKVMEENRRL